MNTNPISIDPPGARELDDAIAVRREGERWTVDVWLPDVPALVTPGSTEDRDARERGVTVYANSAVRTAMLPPDVVERLSLSPDRDGPVIGITLSVAPDLIASVQRIERLQGRTAARLSYAEADRAISDVGHPHHAALSGIWDLARRLHADRAAGTGARFDVEAHLFTNEEGQTVALDERSAHRSNMAVMEMMILVNGTLAAHVARQGLPILFRNHRPDGMARGDRASVAGQLAIRERIGRREAAVRLRAMAHLIAPAEMGTDATGHFGLDLPAYAWFTSPLRRYCDVVNLRALLDGISDPEIDALAVRLTGIHRRQREESSEHHGRMHRRRIIHMIAQGRHQELADVDVHTIVRALDENPGFDAAAAVAHIGRRLADDDLTGRDIAAIEDGASALFGAKVAERIGSWIHGNAARRQLVEDHRGSAAPTPAVQEGNAKADVHLMATRMKARIVFDEPVRTGPPHAPIFTSRVRWTTAAGTVEAEGTGRTKRMAEHAASQDLMARLPDPGDGETSTRDAHTHVPGAPSAQEKAPKTEILELAVARRARVDFGPAIQQQTPQGPIFTVTAVWRSSGGDRQATGRGSRKRDAEREASVRLLEMLLGRQAANVERPVARSVIDRLVDAGFEHVRHDEPHEDHWLLEQAGGGTGLLVERESSGWRICRTPRDGEAAGEWIDVATGLTDDACSAELDTLLSRPA